MGLFALAADEYWSNQMTGEVMDRAFSTRGR